MNRTKRALLASMLFAAAGFHMATAKAAVDPKAFGEIWQSQGTPSNQQSQVIYYRDDAKEATEAAMIYVDGQFQAALLPGMFTRFCVAPGEHSMGGYLHDAPGYKGKSEQNFRATLKAGKTYFLRVDTEANGQPKPVRSADAEQALRQLRLQMHALSRASAVQACEYAEGPVVDYTLASDLLFNFGKFHAADMQAGGREAIEALVKRLKQQKMQHNKIEIIGHTDAIGSASRNLQLGEERAATVRQLMISAGLPAGQITTRSLGSSQPAVQCTASGREEQIRCNAPNRRVVVRVVTNQ